MDNVSIIVHDASNIKLSRGAVYGDLCMTIGSVRIFMTLQRAAKLIPELEEELERRRKKTRERGLNVDY